MTSLRYIFMKNGHDHLPKEMRTLLDKPPVDFIEKLFKIYYFVLTFVLALCSRVRLILKISLHLKGNFTF